MSEIKAEYKVAIETHGREFVCACGNVLGQIRDIGEIHALVIRGIVIIGEAKILCGDCGRYKKWDFVRRQESDLPPFVGRMLARRQAIDTLIEEAKALING